MAPHPDPEPQSREGGPGRRQSRARDLFRARDGNVAILFGLLSVPLLMFTGAAVDYGLATRTETKLQAATDATALLLCQTPTTTSTTDLNTLAQTTMNGAMGATGLVVDPLGIVASPRQITLTTHKQSLVSFGKITGTTAINPSAVASCANAVPRTFEIALVLDNTGSMENAGNDGVKKITALQNAAKSFISSVFSNPAFGAGTRISIVPFASSVAVGSNSYSSASWYSTANWIDTQGKSAYHWTNVSGAASAGFTSRLDIFTKLNAAAKAKYSNFAWAGCFDALPYPQNVTDTGVTVGSSNTLYIPYFAPDEPGNGANGYQYYNGYYNPGNSYIDDYKSGSTTCPSNTGLAYTAAEARACKYVSPQSPSSGLPPDITANGTTYPMHQLGPTGPNFGCTTQPLQTLTSNSTTLTNLINGMVAYGSTDIHEGFMWGWRTLSPNSVLGGSYSPVPTSVPSAYGSATVSKVIVLMTDGFNEWVQWTTSPYTTPNLSIFSGLGYYMNADGSYSSPHFPSSYQNLKDQATARNAVDALTLAACTNAKASPASISIYTVGLSTTSDPIDTQGITLLKNCASSSSQYFQANDATSLNTAFSKIVTNIGKLRLTQ